MTLRRRLDPADADADLVLSWSAAVGSGGRLQRGRHTEEESRQERCTQSVEKHHGIDVDPIAAGQARFQRGRQQVHAPESDEDADSGAACREHEALDGQLTREPGAAGSERDTN